jgi:hypothetical protein
MTRQQRERKVVQEIIDLISYNRMGHSGSFERLPVENMEKSILILKLTQQHTALAKNVCKSPLTVNFNTFK